MAYINSMATRIQMAFKAYMARMGVMDAMQRRRRLKMIVSDLCIAWRTRRSLNCLGTEVQEFVNCENEKQRSELRNHFHLLFDKVLRNKLFLESNFDRLQKFKVQITSKMQQSKKSNRNSKPTSSSRGSKAQAQQLVPTQKPQRVE